MNKQDKVPAFFQDVGEKIRTDAHVVYTVGWVLGVCGAIVSIVVALWQSNAAIAVIGVIGCLLLGACLAIVSRLMYGFGEVVDTAIVIRGTPQEESVDLTAVNPFDIAQTDGEEDADDVWLCPHCEGDLVAHPATGMWYCPDCGKQYRVEGAGWTKRLVETK